MIFYHIETTLLISYLKFSLPHVESIIFTIRPFSKIGKKDENQTLLNKVSSSSQVTFPECVRWITIEFDPQCGTAQSEDVLRLLIPVRTIQNSGYGPKLTSVHENLNSWIELKKFSGSAGWPTMVLVLPGKLFFLFMFNMVKSTHL